MFLPLLAGSLHVGDEIIEINGQSVSNHSVDQLQKMLVGICVWRGCSPGVTPLAYGCACWLRVKPLLDTRANHTAARGSDVAGARAAVPECLHTAKYPASVHGLGGLCCLGSLSLSLEKG